MESRDKEFSHRLSKSGCQGICFCCGVEMELVTLLQGHSSVEANGIKRGMAVHGTDLEARADGQPRAASLLIAQRSNAAAATNPCQLACGWPL